MKTKSYLKYTVGIFLGIIAIYWIQYNLFPTPDIPTGLGVAEFSLIGGIAFWLERTYKFIKSIMVSLKNNSNNEVNNETLVASNKSKNKTQGFLISIIAILLIIILATNTDIINFSKKTMLSEVEIKYVPKESSRIQYFQGTNGYLMDSM